MSLADLLPAATAACCAALAPHTGRDWRAVPAADLEWSCWDTVVHVNDDLYYYAVQVLYAPPDRDWPGTELTPDDSATPARMLAAVTVHGELLRRVVLSADPGDRAWHVYGVSDAEGFAAMGVVEVLVHTYDVVRALDPGSTWRPPAALAASVLARLFPDAPDGEPDQVLLHCCGRLPLGDRPRPGQWRWDGRVRGG